MIIGLDLGSTTTKIVLMDGLTVVDKCRIPHEKSYLDIIKGYDLSRVDKIVTVGAGASFIEGDILGIKTEKVEEFQAVALGGHFLSGYDECLVVSLGTGTSFMYVNNTERVHVGGTGIGGALLQALARIGGATEDVGEFLSLAEKGNIENADLLIKDISKVDIDNLYGDVTAANMAKLTKDSAPEDYAFGVCNMIFQNIGVMSVMADRPYGTKKVIVMGSVGESAVAGKCFKLVGDLFGYEFTVPRDAVFGVAIGAVLFSDEEYVNRLSIYGRDMDDADYLFE